SLINKMPGDNWQKFANLRLLFSYMYSQPGKKLLFMGGEFGQWQEWNHNGSLYWHLLGWPLHKGVRRWVRDLNTFYRGEPALHQLDCDAAGFEWVDCDDADMSVISFLRLAGSGAAPLLVACNFTPVPRENYRLGVPHGGVWRELLNSDATEYGGSGLGNSGAVQARDEPAHGRAHCLLVRLPPLAVLVLGPG
ncbi:MAG: alpha amylase C-terminal domain-containing protein, partial [Gammaproteobacteria bacterium]|nr:alpha amylase C-terminal domain-containing protein [Gammaproteobacteria bacterium]